MSEIRDAVDNEKLSSEKLDVRPLPSTIVSLAAVNASGHEDKLERQYGLLSIISAALAVDIAWVAVGASLVVASANGGPPGVIYELLAGCFYYLFINLSLAELASAIPSSAGVYHYASVTPGPRYGRVVGFFTGVINFWGWLIGTTSAAMLTANTAVGMYKVFHPAVHIEPWHIFVTFLVVSWSPCLFVIFCNRLLPTVEKIGGAFVFGGGLVTCVVCLARGAHHASSATVWTKWENATGWPDGVAFMIGILNGAFAIGTSDAITHMAEEMPHPRKDLPKAIMVQLLSGTITSFIFLVSILYGVTDFSVILTSDNPSPLAILYLQATGSRAATLVLLIIVFVQLISSLMGGYITSGRILWTLARDNVTPCAKTLSRVSVARSCPIAATVTVGVLVAAFGSTILGSATAFADLAGSFILLTTTSYLLAILPHLLTGRKNTPIGPFWMGRWGAFVNFLAVLFIVVTNIFYCFPYARPVKVSTMNYSSVILAGLVGLTALWWSVHGVRHYRGPRLQHLNVVVQNVHE